MDLVTFLKKHTKISNNFIDDFFGLYDPKDKYNFTIDVENVVKWLDMRKDHMKDTLLYSYEENVDYKIIKNVKTAKDKIVGAPKQTILMTPKCFKLMAMQSRTKKAVEVREYYYELEQVVDRYKEYIIQGLEEKIKKLENNQKPKINSQKGVIYIIQAADDTSMYKIGRAVDMKTRSYPYNADKKDDIIPLYIYETDDVIEVEKCVKAFSAKYQYRKRKEIYETDINKLKEIIDSCGELNCKLNLTNKNISKKNARQKSVKYYIAIVKKDEIKI